MDMVPVDSSAISSVGYDPATKVMRVLFKSGACYDHRNTTAQQHQALISAKSIGAHYAKHHGKDGVKVKTNR
jgi:hypothetical protein